MEEITLNFPQFEKGHNPDKHVFEVYVTESPADITAEHLVGVECLVMNNVSGKGHVLNKTQKDVIEVFVAGGYGTAALPVTIESGGSTDSWP